LAAAHFFLIAPALAGSSAAPFGSFVLFPIYEFRPFYLERTLRRIWISLPVAQGNLVSGKERKSIGGGATRVIGHRQTSGKVLASIYHNITYYSILQSPVQSFREVSRENRFSPLDYSYSISLREVWCFRKHHTSRREIL
jgi:hypothetical protein